MRRALLAEKARPASEISGVRPGTLQRRCACGGKPQSGGECAECGAKHLGLGPAVAALGNLPAVVEEAVRTPGSPLPAETRERMEQRFGHDFGSVRVHSDARAAASAEAVRASAYTLGRDIVFGAGQYAPASASGERLLAHELTHVVQQSRGGGSAGGAVGLTRAEAEADRVSDQVTRGETAPSVEAVESPGLRFKCDLATPKDCATYSDWLGKFPNMSGTTDESATASMPADLQGLITGKLSAGGGLPDCADVAFLLRHYYLKAKDQSYSFMVGRDKETAETYTLGKNVTDKEVRACMSGAGTTTFQEERKGFGVVDFYKTKSVKTKNLKALLAAGLKAGDMFVWKRKAGITGNFQGHAQTVQAIKMPVSDGKGGFTTGGTITLAQGNMSAGKGVGDLQLRVYTFEELTGKKDGDADIGDEPRHHEEEFFGAGPWKS